MQNEIKRNPLVLATAGVRHHIGDSCPRYEFDLNGEKQEVEYMEVGENYLDVMDIQTLQGRPFSADLETDYQNAIMINEKFAEMFFPNKNPIGESITFFDTLQVTVIGVVRDFMQDSFFDPLRPLALKYSKADRFLYMAVRSESKDLAAVQTALASAWKTHFPTKPFEHNYQNEFLANAMEVTNNIKKTTSVLAIISVILTITGLFALMSLSILKRMKEIAVRRVLGASVGNISFIINRNYFWIILMGIIIGSGIGAWLSLRLLDSIYNIHAGVNSVVLFAAGLLASIAVLLTIGLKIWQVMQMNPAEVLKGD
jgi:ABC-type antimicrobial peptide transport system permease subunit